MIGWNELIFAGDLLAAGAMLLIAGRLGRPWIVMMIVICTLTMNIVVMKQMTLFGLTVTGGNVMFATVFLANDVLNEHFGRPAARQAVLLGFGSGLAAMVLLQFALWYAPNNYDTAQGHLEFFFNLKAYPRIIAASMTSYLLAQLLDAQLYHFIRQRTGTHRLFWLRSNASMWISQAFDTAFFTTVALTGLVIHSWPEWRDQVIFAYIIKLVVAMLDTPFLYLTTWRPLRPPGSQREAICPE